VTRDLDILRELAGVGAVAVYLSVTTLDPGLARRLEPRASSPRQRLEAMARLVEAGIPAGPSIAPVIPGLNDEEIPAIIDAAAQAGAGFATWGMLRLPGQVEGIFSDWLDREEPGRKEKVLNRIRSAREGRLNQPSGPGRMHGSGWVADQVEALFCLLCRKKGLATKRPGVSFTAFRKGGAGPVQGELFPD
jgi:DNA repair photolyase